MAALFAWSIKLTASRQIVVVYTAFVCLPHTPCPQKVLVCTLQTTIIFRLASHWYWYAHKLWCQVIARTIWVIFAFKMVAVTGDTLPCVVSLRTLVVKPIPYSLGLKLNKVYKGLWNYNASLKQCNKYSIIFISFKLVHQTLLCDIYHSMTVNCFLNFNTETNCRKSWKLIDFGMACWWRRSSKQEKLNWKGSWITREMWRFAYSVDNSSGSLCFG